MNRVILFLIIFLVTDLDAQLIYSLKTEPFGLHKEGSNYKAFQLYDLQFSIKGKTDSIFFYEIQPGIIFNGIMPHLDFFIGGEYSVAYFKVGIKYYLSISGGGSSGPSIESGFLPGIGSGFYIMENIFLELNYMIGFATVGIGINL